MLEVTPPSRRNQLTERAGFEQTQIANLFKRLYLSQKQRSFTDLDYIEHLLVSHGFLLPCDPI